MCKRNKRNTLFYRVDWCRKYQELEIGTKANPKEERLVRKKEEKQEFRLGQKLKSNKEREYDLE